MIYKINQINDSTLQIIDEYDGCIYAIKGTQKGIVIDTGMSRDSLKPVIEDFIKTPYDVVLTHGHIDHIGRTQEFENIYMSSNDNHIYEEHTHLSQDPNDRFNTIGLAFQDIHHIHNIQEKQIFSLGDREIIAIPCFGHTPGSFLFADMKTHCLFTGDAIGSGCGVWMQVDNALSIQQYYESLNKTIDIFDDLNINKKWAFLGGHAYQEYQSQVSKYNALDMQLLYDMRTLCQKIIHNDVEFYDVKTREFSTGKPYYAVYKKAEMIFTLSQI